MENEKEFDAYQEFSWCQVFLQPNIFKPYQFQKACIICMQCELTCLNFPYHKDMYSVYTNSEGMCKNKLFSSQQ